MRCHARNVVLKDCKFIVSEAGQKRVRQEGKKNVHAFIEGFAVSRFIIDEKIAHGNTGWDVVYYNPYKTFHFVTSSIPDGEYVETAELVDVWCDENCGDVSAFNLGYRKCS